MNGIENITEKIRAEAAASSAKIDADAAGDAKAIAEKYAAAAESEKAAIIADAKQKAANEALRADSQADINARNRRLAARREVIAEAFDLALAELCHLDDEKYLSWMERMVKDAQTADGEVIMNEADRAKYGEELVRRAAGDKKLALAADTGSFAGGFILREGQIETNCTFEVLINSSREDLEGEIAAVLFE